MFFAMYHVWHDGKKCIYGCGWQPFESKQKAFCNLIAQLLTHSVEYKAIVTKHAKLATCFRRHLHLTLPLASPVLLDQSIGPEHRAPA